ncbi:LysR family transcriptional regulator [uncultured Pseudomonas sp.]|uniref:LysR family transcriptional regulator n=1 Tax=uncultured Pseudomonas sp. TaxID=114707 RepID=UPI0025DF47F7|nr:LysR family transcriptional regulator [uncultured Pseudomonas sp.]
MDRLKAMANFVRIVDSGSLSSAADASGQSVASVVRSLAALEKHLGVRLLNRTTRRMALTDEGSEYLAWSRRMFADFDAMQQRLDARRQTPGGLLRLTAPVEFGQQHLAPLVSEFLKAHPQMRVELTFSDLIVDLLDQGLDLAVRIGRLPDSSLVARAIGRTRLVTCASPHYLQQAPALLHPQDLEAHDCIVYTGQGRHWYFQEAHGERGQEIQPRLTTNQVRAARQAAIDGLGVTRLLHYQACTALADGRLQRVLREFEPQDLPIQLVYPHARTLPARVRSFIDWAAPRLEAQIPDPNVFGKTAAVR